MVADRPSVLFVFTDEQWAGAMSCAGNDELRTPQMDGLAAEGMRFDRAYCSQPLCVPSRGTLMTGVMPHTHGVTTNRTEAPDFVAGVEGGRWPMMGRLFSEAGYRTGYFGKWHVPVPMEREDVHGFGPTKWLHDWEVPRRFAEFVDGGEGPFLAVVSLTNPHNICEWARGGPLPDCTLGSPPPPEACPELPANFEVPAGEPGWIREFQRRRAASYIAPGFDEGQWRQYRWAYWRLVEEADRRLGHCLAAVRALADAENTLVVLSSDHGDGAGAHRWCQKQVFYEEAVRVPLIVRPPGGMRGAVDGRLVSQGVDVLPTLLDWAGLEVPAAAQGESLRGAVEGGGGPEREFVVSETDFTPGAERWGAGGRMVRTERLKYCVYDRVGEGDASEQLFDLDSDPGEMRDLSGEAAWAGELERHRGLLRGWLAETGDVWGGQPR
jgi:choline-sulfatase